MKLKKHTKAWFVARIGKDIIRQSTPEELEIIGIKASRGFRTTSLLKFHPKGVFSIFNPPITIASKSHAIALFLTQVEKGYKYQEII